MQSIYNYPDISISFFTQLSLCAYWPTILKLWNALSFSMSYVCNNVQIRIEVIGCTRCTSYIAFRRKVFFIQYQSCRSGGYVCGILDPRFLSRRPGSSPCHVPKGHRGGTLEMWARTKANVVDSRSDSSRAPTGAYATPSNRVPLFRISTQSTLPLFLWPCCFSRRSRESSRSMRPVFEKRRSAFNPVVLEEWKGR